MYDTYVTVCLVVFVLRVLTNRPLPCIVVYRVRTAVEVPVLTFSVFVEDIALAPANAALMYVCIIPRRGASGEDVPSEKVLIENFMFVVVWCWLRFATLLVL